MKILALDPGGTTGIARTSYNKTKDRCEAIYVDELSDQHHSELWKLLCQENPDVVVYETFLYQNRATKVVLDSPEYIGVAKLYAQLTKKRTAPQTAALGKKLWTDKKLRALELWVPSSPHAMDATRHLLYFVTVQLKCNYYVSKLRAAGVE